MVILLFPVLQLFLQFLCILPAHFISSLFFFPLIFSYVYNDLFGLVEGPRFSLGLVKDLRFFLLSLHPALTYLSITLCPFFLCSPWISFSLRYFPLPGNFPSLPAPPLVLWGTQDLTKYIKVRLSFSCFHLSNFYRSFSPKYLFHLFLKDPNKDIKGSDSNLFPTASIFRWKSNTQKSLFFDLIDIIPLLSDGSTINCPVKAPLEIPVVPGDCHVPTHSQGEHRYFFCLMV